MFYNEGQEQIRIVLKKFTSVRKYYFETTLLDKLHVILNGGATVNPGQLPPDWQKLSDAVTVRCVLWDQKNGKYQPINKLDISGIPSGGSVDESMKEWGKFKYCPRGAPSDNPLRHFSTSTAGQVSPQALLPATSRPGEPDVNTATVPTTAPVPELAPARRVNGNIENTLRIAQWAKNVETSLDKPRAATGIVEIMARGKPKGVYSNDSAHTLTRFC